jgi:hypothetical protein
MIVDPKAHAADRQSVNATANGAAAVSRIKAQSRGTIWRMLFQTPEVAEAGELATGR